LEDHQFSDYEYGDFAEMIATHANDHSQKQPNFTMHSTTLFAAGAGQQHPWLIDKNEHHFPTTSLM
jgi:hypothetical protein